MQMILQAGEVQLLVKELKRTRNKKLKKFHERVAGQVQREEDNAKDFETYRRVAGHMHASDGVLEIDPGAVVSDSERGAYVMAWVWVDGVGAGVIKDEEDDDEDQEEGGKEGA